MSAFNEESSAMTIPIPRSSAAQTRMNQPLATSMLAVSHDTPPQETGEAAARTSQLVSAEGREDQQRIVRDAHACLTDPTWFARQRPPLGYLGFVALVLTEIAVFISAFQLITSWGAVLELVPEGEPASKSMLMTCLIANVAWMAVIVWRSLSPVRTRKAATVLYWIVGAIAASACLFSAMGLAQLELPSPHAFSPTRMTLAAFALACINYVLTTRREKGIVAQ